LFASLEDYWFIDARTRKSLAIMPVKKRPPLEKSIFDAEFDQDRADRRTEDRVQERIASEEMRRCYDILAWQMEQPIAAVFLEPVDWRALDMPLYPKLIKQPMDYGTIKTRLLGGAIPTPGKFAELMRLVYKNAMKFNQQGSQIYDITEKLFNEFEGNYELVKLEKPTHTHVAQMEVSPAVEVVADYSEYEATIASLEAKYASLQEEASALKASYQAQAEEQALKLQPHLRIETLSPFCRAPFTTEEKEALCQRIASLADEEVINGLLKVINVNDNSSEVELDFENFDDETLHRVAAYIDSLDQDEYHPPSRYGYDDDYDYVDPSRKKKKGVKA
jgi:bromodomain-containing factor 1